MRLDRKPLAAAVILFVAILAGCGGEDGSTSETHPSAPRDPVFSEAPAVLRQLEPVELCGRERLDLADRRGDPVARRCLDVAWSEHRPAELISVAGTIEGDPIPRYFRVRDDDVLVVTDSTADRYGSQEWTVRGCLRLDALELDAKGCSISIVADEQTPAAVVLRRTLPYCGRVTVIRPRPGREAAVYGCVRDALRSVSEAEFETVEPGHPIVRLIRLTRDGIEVFENSGGYSPGDDRWSYGRCKRLAGPELEPTGCSRFERLALGDESS